MSLQKGLLGPDCKMTLSAEIVDLRCTRPIDSFMSNRKHAESNPQHGQRHYFEKHCGGDLQGGEWCNQ